MRTLHLKRPLVDRGARARREREDRAYLETTFRVKIKYLTK